MSFFRLLRPSRLTVHCRTYATNTAPQGTGATQSASQSKPVKKASSGTGATAVPQSSCPADTILPGINYLKGQPPVLALADDQYPDWLWTVLEPKVWPEDGPGGKAERARRRQENKQRIKERNFMSTQ
ncbi:hypothetical protein AX17_005429 [Amanita inopinata Kibby_2008]|nr:hypothetical protein AX17_005429 [Amanita inopinata Kibby_2008]